MKELHKRGSKAWLCAQAGLQLLILTITVVAAARLDDTQKPYYGRELYENIVLRDSYPELKKDLYIILSREHMRVEGDFDQILEDCKGANCYEHKELDRDVWEAYRKARIYLFGALDLQFNERAGYSITGVYCNEIYTDKDFSEKYPLGRDRIPDYKVINAEHTWPQSRFNKRYSVILQKTDLHAIFPAGQAVNSSRSNHEFAEVSEVITSQCPGAFLGYARPSSKQRYFEPPDNHKGNVARALFYFSTRYNLVIDDFQEGFLREWHKLDPIDQAELDRHDRIFEFQNTRNPYVDHPELVDMIANF